MSPTFCLKNFQQCKVYLTTANLSQQFCDTKNKFNADFLTLSVQLGETDLSIISVGNIYLAMRQKRLSHVDKKQPNKQNTLKITNKQIGGTPTDKQINKQNDEQTVRYRNKQTNQC